MRRKSSWSQKMEERNFPEDFFTRIFWGGLSCYIPNPLIVALSPGHSDVTRYPAWSPVAPNRKSFGSRRKNSKSCSDEWHNWRFWSAFRHFGTHFAESFRISKSLWMMDPARSREMLGCSAIDLAKIRWSSKISSLIWSINSQVDTFFGSSRTRCNTGEKITTFNLGHTVSDGGIHWCMFHYYFCQNGVKFLQRLALQEKKLVDSFRLDVVEIARVAWHASFQPL